RTTLQSEQQLPRRLPSVKCQVRTSHATARKQQLCTYSAHHSPRYLSCPHDHRRPPSQLGARFGCPSRHNSIRAGIENNRNKPVGDKLRGNSVTWINELR